MERQQHRKPGETRKGKKVPKTLALTPKERRDLKNRRKAKKPYAEVVTSMNQLYQVGSISSKKKKEREEIIGRIVEVGRGHLLEVSRRHGASRILQSIVKYGSAEHRELVFSELRLNFVMLTLNTYGHHVVLKLLQYGTDKMQQQVLSEFLANNNVTSLCTQRFPATVLDYLFANADARDQLAILQEFYGSEFLLFHSTSGAPLSLKEALATRSPEKQVLVLSEVREHIGKLIDKDMVVFRFAHALMMQYLENAPHDVAAELVAELAKLALFLHESRDGCRVISHCISYGSVKVRKHLLKTIRSEAVVLATHQFAYMPIIRALDVVDDTVLLRKSILQPLLDDLGTVAADQHGARVLLHVLAPRNPKYFAPWDLQQLAPPMIDGELTFKKDPEKRRMELLSALLPPLLETCLESLSWLSRLQHGADVADEAFLLAHNGGVDESMVCDNFVPRLCKAVADLVDETADSNLQRDAADTAETVVGGKPLTKAELAAAAAEKSAAFEPALVHRFAHYCVKRLLVGLKPNSHAVSRAMWEVLEHVSDEVMQQYATTNRSAFVLTSIIETGPADVVGALKAKLGQYLDELKTSKWAGCKVLVKHLTGQVKRKSADSPQAQTTKKTKKAKKGKQKKKKN